MREIFSENEMWNLPFHKNKGFQKINDRNWALGYGDVLVRNLLIVSNSRWNLHGIHLRAETEQQSPFTKFTIPKKEFYKELTYNPDNDTYLIPSDYLTGSFPAIVKTLQVRFSQIAIQFTPKSYQKNIRRKHRLRTNAFLRIIFSIYRLTLETGDENLRLMNAHF